MPGLRPLRPGQRALPCITPTYPCQGTLATRTDATVRDAELAAAQPTCESGRETEAEISASHLAHGH